MAKPTKKEDDFSYAELVEYETLTGEPFAEIYNDEKPRLMKVAYLGWIKSKREEPGLKFDEYLEDGDRNIAEDAFGKQDDPEAKKEETSTKRGQRPKPDSA